MLYLNVLFRFIQPATYLLFQICINIHYSTVKRSKFWRWVWIRTFFSRKCMSSPSLYRVTRWNWLPTKNKVCQKFVSMLIICVGKRYTYRAGLNVCADMSEFSPTVLIHTILRYIFSYIFFTLPHIFVEGMSQSWSTWQFYQLVYYNFFF